MPHRWLKYLSAALLLINLPLYAQNPATMPMTTTRPMHDQSEHAHQDPPADPPPPPPLPEGMTLDEVLARAAQAPPAHWPQPIHDDKLYAFAWFEQLEYRIPDTGRDQIGWDAQAYIGYDYDKIWFKSEGDLTLDGPDSGESENDLLYSRLIAPFWNAQIGVQYANDWNNDDYNDRWSGVLALKGLLPYMYELDTSLYLSTEGDLTANIEAIYDWRLTQRLVLQPRAEIILAAQDVPERDLGAGLAESRFDLRLRYEFKREFAPYIGLRYQLLTGETADIAQRNGEDTEDFYFLVGLRVAF